MKEAKKAGEDGEDTRNYKVLYDPALLDAPPLPSSSSREGHGGSWTMSPTNPMSLGSGYGVYLPGQQTSGYWREVMEFVRRFGSEKEVKDRIKCMNHSRKESLWRYDGEVVVRRGEWIQGEQDEDILPIRDPRRDKEFLRAKAWKVRTELSVIPKYEVRFFSLYQKEEDVMIVSSGMRIRLDLLRLLLFLSLESHLKRPLRNYDSSSANMDRFCRWNTLWTLLLEHLLGLPMRNMGLGQLLLNVLVIII